MTSPLPPEHQPPLPYLSDTGHDEAFPVAGEVRPHWRYLLDSLGQLGADEMGQRQIKTQRILRDDGAVYNSADQPDQSKVWELDPVPLILQSDEWSQIEAGLIERAELLNLIQQDLYGERQLIRHGILPPELLFAHKGFIRASHNVRLPGEQQLIFHSADLIRTPDQGFCILTDRTQAPRGIGYSLENRTVMSRVFPSIFRDSQVHRLAVFYQSLRQTLHALAPAAVDKSNPSIVLLTPGTYSPSYFEHTYLANYLGYPLVQGRDLTVRGGRVWMKSVSGLHPVDVILRFVDDPLCDPLELRGDSQLGVAGLLEAARNGNVSIVNPIGTGLLENPALMKYLPAISEFFLGRTLQLASVNSYWGGDAADLIYILANFSQLVLKGITPLTGGSILLRELSAAHQQQWKDEILRHPKRYVAQDYLEPSSCPTLIGGTLQPRRILMRSFAVASGQSYTILPGGLARIAPSQNDFRVSQVQGSLTKDTWVLASEPEKQLTLKTPPSRSALPFTGQINLPSRVVENLFWLGRYAERAEASARLLRAALLQLNSNVRLPTESRALLLTAITRVTGTLPGFVNAQANTSLTHPDHELLSVILDKNRNGGLKNTLLAMFNCAEEVKELLSTDVQRIINTLRDELSRLKLTLSQGLGSVPEEAFDSIITNLLALAGQAHESMFRGTGWSFLEIGRRLEKASLSAELMRAMLVDCAEDSTQELALETTLLSMEALISYRRRYLAELNVADGLHLMLLDKNNPRSLLFLLEQISNQMKQLRQSTDGPGLSAEEKQLLAARTALQLSDIDELIKADDDGLIRANLEQLLSHLKAQLYEAAKLISSRYFDHSGGPKQILLNGWEQHRKRPDQTP
ncbi:circularly permuted type 2 ATP-grasp protein (plasmid) [Amphritea atlantica]|uniref:Circularly permuted type 2 ATP-grasp protein n=1 Tax=Amphritea atlantica TaxID=355243 RepID=A0ABY5H088_9GAMM|nr:circularly permuted type 2 ATP-grasp protein [Amphritea atlantica]